MSRRAFLGSAPLAAAAQRPPLQPNVVLIVVDDLGAGDLGFQGSPDIRTPNLDALAADGVRFTNWYSNAPVCAPARASILTGMYPARAGVPANRRALTPGTRTLARLLRDAGYATACIGKWHLGDTEDTVPNAHGFQYFYGFHSGCVDFYSHRFYWGEPARANFHDLWRNREEIFEDGQYLTTRITEESGRFLERHRGQPCFLYAAYNAPHYPMHAPDAYTRRFAHLPLERRIYAAMIAAVDDGVGVIRETLRAQNRLEETLFIFVSDNGATTERRAGLDQKPATAGSSGKYRGYKFSLFDGGMHVPALISWTGRHTGAKTVHEVAMSMDILPTVCAAAHIAPPDEVDGRNLLPVAFEGAPSPHEAIFWESGGQKAVRKGPWKLVVDGRTFDGTPAGSKPLAGVDAMWLSNLDEDPGESRNLRAWEPRLVDELATALESWRGKQPR
ncbi:MAG: sulfatase-like hydrolase/transferase [Bryobacterales bacterium]|nr:sulfatase-like hydrolase/transferase [Bryobacterales bacterium]